MEKHQNRRVAGGGVGGSAPRRGSLVVVLTEFLLGLGILRVPVVVIRTPKRDDPGRIV